MWCTGVPVRGEVILNTDEREHSDRMRRVLALELSSLGGWMSFEHYMDLVLYSPGLGYYSSGTRKFGSGGDFTTAPEVSRLFGACVAQQCTEILNEVSHGRILEIGAGTGKLAVDVLMRLEALKCLPERYLILEISGDLRDRQRALIARHIPHLQHRVTWLDVLPDAPWDGVIIANEVLDALPVVRFRWGADECQELGVACEHDEFVWSPRAASDCVSNRCHRLQISGGWEDGYVSEYCARLQPWTAAVTASLRTGAALWFDYGLPRAQYYLAERHEGTLICHFRHRAQTNPFAHPGLQDISAWVDFTSLAEAGASADYELAGFTTQAFFLAGLGIDTQMHNMAGDDESQFARLAGEARQLLMPGEMGESFKSMAWTRGISRELSGFALQDLRHTV
jgi:SAM-dependent MidA family methyltransferase